LLGVILMVVGSPKELPAFTTRKVLPARWTKPPTSPFASDV
jgi:hypothetical protein